MKRHIRVHIDLEPELGEVFSFAGFKAKCVEHDIKKFCDDFDKAWLDKCKKCAFFRQTGCLRKWEDIEVELICDMVDRTDFKSVYFEEVKE